MVSTPGQPEGLFFNIENEPEDQCIYHRMKLDYKVGLGKIYTAEDIAKAQASPSFAQEYCLSYGGSVGNIFREQDIQLALSQYHNHIH